MAIKTLRIGSMSDIHQYEDGDFDSAIETDHTIKAGAAPTANDEMVRYQDIPTPGTAVSSSAVLGDNRVLRGDGGARGIQESLAFIDDAGNITLPGGSTVDGRDISVDGAELDLFPDELQNLVTAEIQQLENIGAVTISAAQWGYLGDLDQALTTSDDVEFNTLSLPGGLITVGINDSQYGILYAYGNATGSNRGGRVNLEIADDYNATYELWSMRVIEDELRFTIDSTVIMTLLDSGSLYLSLTTETLYIDDAGSAGATEQDWIEVRVGGTTGYIRVFASK